VLIDVFVPNPIVPLFAVRDWAMTVILEAVDPALRIFLDVPAGHRIPVVVSVLLAFAVARTVVRRIVGGVDAVFAGTRLGVPRIARGRQFFILRTEDQTVRPNFSERCAVSAIDTAHAHREKYGEYDACGHAGSRSNRLSTCCRREFLRQTKPRNPPLTAGRDRITKSDAARACWCETSAARCR
jgi:hypothetical protein